jgi:DNA topoisomerase IB
MISVRKNPNFKEWFQVFAFGKMVDEVRRESEALQLAKLAGRRVKQDYIYFVDRPIKLEKVK